MTPDWLVGGYGPDMKGAGRGIYAARTAGSGALEIVGLAAEAPSPSYLARRGEHVYSALEGEGRVASYRSTPAGLVADGAAPSGGTWPCQLSFAAGGIVAANYFTGTVGLVSLTADGAVDELVQVVQDEGSGPRPGQESAHAHATLPLGEGRLLVVDLGSDSLGLHDVASGRLIPEGTVRLAPGTGPRDVALHESGILFILGELSGQLLSYRVADGGLAAAAPPVALPGAREGDHASGISFGPNGFVYVGLRGSQRIAVLHADAAGALEPVGWVPSAGDWPRHHTVDGDVLHVANEHSNSIASFRLGADGIPALIADPTPVPSPTYLLHLAG